MRASLDDGWFPLADSTLFKFATSTMDDLVESFWQSWRENASWKVLNPPTLQLCQEWSSWQSLWKLKLCSKYCNIMSDVCHKNLSLDWQKRQFFLSVILQTVRKNEWCNLPQHNLYMKRDESTTSFSQILCLNEKRLSMLILRAPMTKLYCTESSWLLGCATLNTSTSSRVLRLARHFVATPRSITGSILPKWSFLEVEEAW